MRKLSLKNWPPEEKEKGRPSNSYEALVLQLYFKLPLIMKLVIYGNKFL